MTRLLSALEWLPRLSKQWLRADVVAGLTTAAVVLPKAFGYASLAGLPVQVGLYTSFVPMVAYALLGTSRVLSVSTTSALAILTATALHDVVPGDDPSILLQACAVLTLLAGVALVLAALLRLGFIATFISEPVLVGFKAGIGIVIVIDQLPKLIGLHIAKGSLLHNIAAIALASPGLSLPTLLLGAVTLAVLAGLQRIRPQWPAALLIIAPAVASVAWLGIDRYGIALVGAIPRGIPALSAPDWSFAEQLWPVALAIAVMSFMESAAAGRAFARGDEPRLRENAELFALGTANVLGSFLGSMPAGGGTSQTAVNRMAGARTPLAALVTAGAALLTMFLLAPLLGLLPQAVLAGIVIFYSASLIKPADFRAILQVRRTEFIWAVVSLLGVALLGTLKGLVLAILVSFVALGEQMASPPVYVLGRKQGTNVFRPRSGEHSDDETFPGLLLLRVDGRVFFLNAEAIAGKMQPLISEARPHVVVIDLAGVFDLEYTALKMLVEAEGRMRDHGVELWLVGLTPGVFKVIQRSSLGATLGRERLLFDLEVAVSRFLHRRERRGVGPESGSA
ncbi:MAG TPA: SulP family inorganic anion transporter [Steroidobacteraceae bacterium]|nr:SulP family inorganic anion transporter [Steroidobacteraceae bacterium]